MALNIGKRIGKGLQMENKLSISEVQTQGVKRSLGAVKEEGETR